MRFSIIVIVTPLLLAGSAFAGYNCKCQDAFGQYNDGTSHCCSEQPGYTYYHHGDSHQCTQPNGGMNNGEFVECCQSLNHGGAYCWN